MATAWPVVAVAPVVSLIARGAKAPARDSLLAGSVEPDQLGRAFGAERAMDSLGTVAGPLLAAPLIVAVGYRWLFAMCLDRRRCPAVGGNGIQGKTLGRGRDHCAQVSGDLRWMCGGPRSWNEDPLGQACPRCHLP